MSAAHGVEVGAGAPERIRELNERVIAAAHDEHELDVWERALGSLVKELDRRRGDDLGEFMKCMASALTTWTRDIRRNTNYPTGALPGDSLTGIDEQPPPGLER